MIEPDWISPSRLRPLFYTDPAVVWLEHHGARYGFLPDDSSYALIKLLEQKGKQFEVAWLSRYAPTAPNICVHASALADPDSFNRWQTLLEQKVPLLAQNPLILPNQKFYGIADCLASSTWLLEHFPQLTPELADLPEHYLVIDLKFTSKLTTSSKKVDLAFYSAQVEFYSYMLGQIQGYMPRIALLITRDQLLEPLVIRFPRDQPPQLSPSLKAYCEQYREIVLNHGHNPPWFHEALRPNYAHSNERWASAKQQIMQREPDGSVEQVWYIGAAARQELATAEIYSLKQLLAADPNQLPKKALRRREPMLAILQANRSQQALKPATARIVSAQQHFLLIVNSLVVSMSISIGSGHSFRANQ